VGFSVAGAGQVYGPASKMRVIAGGPGNALDFGSGLLNIGNTIGTLYNFSFDNNGLGKAYEFNPDLCGFKTLPAHLIQFTGYGVDKTVQLNWKTNNEQSLAYYTVQRSSNGTQFDPISLVFAKGAAINDYDFNDKYPYTGTNYYRLKIVDKDLKFTYSNIITASFSQALPGTATVVPNPVRNVFNVLLEGMDKGVYQLKLYNNVGKLMEAKTITITSLRQMIDMTPNTHFDKGIYWLNVYDNTGRKVNEIKVAMLMD
jgi:hypothetical protein